MDKDTQDTIDKLDEQFEEVSDYIKDGEYSSYDDARKKIDEWYADAEEESSSYFTRMENNAKTFSKLSVEKIKNIDDSDDRDDAVSDVYDDLSKALIEDGTSELENKVVYDNASDATLFASDIAEKLDPDYGDEYDRVYKKADKYFSGKYDTLEKLFETETDRVYLICDTVSDELYEGNYGADEILAKVDKTLDKLETEHSKKTDTAEKETASASSNDNDAEQETETQEKKTNKSRSDLVDGMRPEFKEAMDSYEKFFDKYVAFMKKYKDSDDTSAMMDDYLDYMDQYADTMEKLDEIKEDMNDAEAKYFAEVMGRINEKLATVM